MKNNLENQDIKTDKPVPMSYEALKAECDASLNAERVWETSMMAVCGQDGPASVAAVIKAQLAENVRLKAGPQGFFAYSSECGYEEFDTAEKAMAYAEDEIADFRGNACDGWSDEVGSVVWGVVMQRATMIDLHDATEEDGCDPAIKQCCDYALLPAIETPATSAALDAIEARGAVAAIENLISRKERALAEMHPDTHAYGATQETVRNQIYDLELFAAELREAK